MHLGQCDVQGPFGAPAAFGRNHKDLLEGGRIVLKGMAVRKLLLVLLLTGSLSVAETGAARFENLFATAEFTVVR